MAWSTYWLSSPTKSPLRPVKSTRAIAMASGVETMECPTARENGTEAHIGANVTGELRDANQTGNSYQTALSPPAHTVAIASASAGALANQTGAGRAHDVLERKGGRSIRIHLLNY